MIAVVEVDVATARPPRADAVVRVVIDAEDEVDAQLAACQLAAGHAPVVMVVGSRVVELVEL